jgi:hypothetical protein
MVGTLAAAAHFRTQCPLIVMAAQTLHGPAYHTMVTPKIGVAPSTPRRPHGNILSTSGS